MKKKEQIPHCFSLVFLTFLTLWAVIRGQEKEEAIVNGAHPPVINRFSTQLVQNHGVDLQDGPANRFSIECYAMAQPAAQYNWFKDGVKLLTDQLDGLALSGDNQQILDFFNPNVALHSGLYHCIASNSLGSSHSEVLTIRPGGSGNHSTWMSVPSFTKQPIVEIQEAGKDVTFNCEADGVPKPKIVWTKNGQVMPQGTDRPRLTIPSITTDDVAAYACNASNEAGYDYKTVYLSILTQEPIFIEQPRDRKVSIGQEMILRCGAKGYPKPQIYWMFQGVNITNASEAFDISGRGDLTIREISAGHEGPFTCKATNPLGSSEATGNLTVVTTTTIENGPLDMSAQVKGTVSMNCSVLYDPNFKLQVQWKKDNVKINIDGTRFTQGSTPNYVLTIRDLTFADTGTYTCVAWTTTSTASVSGTLTVTGIPPTLVAGPSRMTVTEHLDLTILCTVTGYPKPTHTWFKDTDRVVYNDRIYMDSSTGTLTILDSNLNDTAKYICRANNGYGEPVVASAFVDVRQKSEVVVAPEHVLYKGGQDVMFDCLVKVDPAMEDSLTVEWYKNNERIEVIADYDNSYNDTDPGNPENPVQMGRIRILANASLHIGQVTEEDVGTYTCQVRTGIDEVVLEAMLYTENDWYWLMILIIVIICVLLVIILVLCIICVRKRSRRKGRYGVKDVTDGKKQFNRSDIQYSIDDDTESLHKDPEDNKTPIIKPNRNNALIDPEIKGSENSLLNLTDDEDLWLRKGMDEDGSFRGRYMAE